MRRIAVGFLGVLGLLVQAVSAQPSYTLTFDNFRETEAPLNYFNGGFGSRGTGPGPQWGITFNAAAAVVTSGTGKVLATASGEAIIMNVPVGFQNSLAVNYVTVLNTGSIRICDSLNCDGQFLASISLPAGSNASQALAFSGIARAAMLSGNGNQIGFRSITLAPLLPPRITTTSLPDGFVGIAYTSPPMTASGGRSPYTWSANNLPVGFQIDSSNGVISGNPTTVGTFQNIEVVLTDFTFPPQRDIRRFSLTIGPPPSPPRVTSCSPMTADEGSGPLEVSCIGAAFTPDAGVRWLADGVETGLATTVQGPTLIKATIPAALLARSGTARLYVAQPSGASAQFTFLITARTRVTVTSNPPGRTVIVDGNAITTPQSFTWAVGSQHTLDAPLVQFPASSATAGATRFAFSRWTQGGSRTQTVTAQPGSQVVYTAVFSTQHLLSVAVSPTQGGAVVTEPAGESGYHDEGTRVSLRADPSAGFRFAGFSREPVLVMNAPQLVNARFTLAGDSPRLRADVPRGGLILDPGAGPQRISLVNSSGGDPLPFTAAVQYGSESDPRWVTLDVSAGSTPTALTIGILPDLSPGSYVASLVLSTPGQPDLSIPLQLTIRQPGAAPAIVASQREIKLSASGAEQRLAGILLRGSGPVPVSFEAMTDGSSWLSVSAAAASVSDSSPALLRLTADPSGLSPGVYFSRVLIRPHGNQPELEIPVSLVVTSSPSLRSVDTALLWRIDRDRKGTLTGIVDLESSSPRWTAWTSRDWLRVTPLPVGGNTKLQVEVDPDQLVEGSNRATISIQQATGSAPGPETIIPVEVLVLPSGYPLARATPSALAFLPQQPGGGGLAGSRRVTLQTSIPGPVRISPSKPWLSWDLRVSSGAVGDRTFDLDIRLSNASLLDPGINRAWLTIQDAAGIASTVEVLALGPSSSCDPVGGPETLLATSLPPRFDHEGGSPATLEVLWFDNCGNPIDSGVVLAATTGPGEPTVNLTSLGSGVWKGTWWPPASETRSSVSLSIHAAGRARAFPVQSLTASIVSHASYPSLDADQLLTSETGTRLRAVSPGSRFRIRGRNLAAEDGAVWPEVLIGGRSIPVLEAMPTSLLVEAPVDLASSAGLVDLIVRVAGVPSMPAPVIVTASARD